jgi:hypothetical protein
VTGAGASFALGQQDPVHVLGHVQIVGLVLLPVAWMVLAPALIAVWLRCLGFAVVIAQSLALQVVGEPANGLAPWVLGLIISSWSIATYW